MKFDPEKIKAALAAIAAGDLEAAKLILEEAVTEAEAGGEEADPDAGEALSAEAEAVKDEALSKVIKILGKNSIGDALIELGLWQADRSERVAALSKVDEYTRAAAVRKLIEIGAEQPATAYSDPAKSVICERLSKEPLADLQTRVAVLSKGRPAAKVVVKAPVAAPTVGSDGKVRRALSKLEQDFCKRENITEDQFFERVNDAAKRA